MPGDVVHTTICNSNRNLLLRSSIGAVLLIGLLFFNIRYLYNVFVGPLAIDQQTLLATADPADLQRYWVTVESNEDDIAYTGFQQVSRNSTTGQERVKASYMALLLDQRVLLVKDQGEQFNTTFTGALEALPASVSTHIVPDLERTSPALRGAFLPYMLNTADFRRSAYIGFGLGLPLFGLCIFGFARALRRSDNPLLHPTMRALARFGSPTEIAGQINAELLAPQWQAGGLRLTTHWLAQVSKRNLAATHIDDVMWVYKQVTQRRFNGISVGKSHAAKIWDRHGVCVTVVGTAALVDQALLEISKRAPWAWMGFNADLQKTWKSNRAALITSADQRRQQNLAK